MFYQSLCFGQETVFITSENFKTEEEKYEGSFYYTQIGFSIPIIVNNEEDYEDQYYQDDDESFWDQFELDGISINAGAGVHFKKWVALGIGTGLDCRINAKLVAVPVYGVLTFNPHFNGDSSFLLQYSYGHSFALGRGDLSGPYQKYKLGIHFDNYTLVYLDVSVIDIPVSNFKNVQSISIGLDLMNFF